MRCNEGAADIRERRAVDNRPQSEDDISSPFRERRLQDSYPLGGQQKYSLIPPANLSNFKSDQFRFDSTVDVLGQEEQVAMTKILSNFISRHQLLGFWCCSAKDDTNVSKPFGTLLQYIVLRADNLSQQEERAS